GITAHVVTSETEISAQVASKRKGIGSERSGVSSTRTLIRPSSANRNFHTEPLTTGGSAQTKTMPASTIADQRPVVRSAIAAASPRPMPIAVTIPATTTVRMIASTIAPLVKPSRQFARPTQGHSWLSVAEPTSETLIRTSWKIGAAEERARTAIPGTRNHALVPRGPPLRERFRLVAGVDGGAVEIGAV